MRTKEAEAQASRGKENNEKKALVGNNGSHREEAGGIQDGPDGQQQLHPHQEVGRQEAIRHHEPAKAVQLFIGKTLLPLLLI